MSLCFRVFSRSFHKSRIKSTVYKIDFDSSLDVRLNTGEIKHKQAENLRQMKNVVLSEELQNAAYKLLLPYSNNQLASAGKKLYQKLWSRHLPLEKEDFSFLYDKNVAAYAAKVGFEIESASPETVKQFKQRFHSKFKHRVDHRASLWQAIDYDSFHGYLYIAYMMAPNFASSNFVLLDLTKIDPEFSPTTMFSFGSGVGTDIWAVNKIWPTSISEYYCVDSSREMLNLADLLLRDGEESNEPFIRGAYFRQFLPASTISYDLVMSTFSLMELPSAEHRLQVIDNLWQKASEYLIIIEPGTNAGFQVILEARDYILNCMNKSENPSNHGYVAAPCPHDSSCPRIANGLSTPCNYSVKFSPLKIIDNVPDLRYNFCYIILKKGKRPDIESWPRCIRPVKIRHKHTACEACCSDGTIKFMDFTKAHHGYNMYKCSRYLSWGDQLPITNIAEREKRNQRKNFSVEEE